MVIVGWRDGTFRRSKRAVEDHWNGFRGKIKSGSLLSGDRRGWESLVVANEVVVELNEKRTAVSKQIQSAFGDCTGDARKHIAPRDYGRHSSTPPGVGERVSLLTYRCGL